MATIKLYVSVKLAGRNLGVRDGTETSVMGVDIGGGVGVEIVYA